MPTGIIINSLSIILGGIAGGLFGDYLRDDFKENLNLIFGLASMVMGISAIMNMVNMPAVILCSSYRYHHRAGPKVWEPHQQGSWAYGKRLVQDYTKQKQIGLAHDEFYGSS